MPKPHIFYAEDNIGDIELIRLSFEDAGMDVVIETVSDGKQALDRLRAARHDADCRYDLILLDINLPVCSGLDVLAFIKKDATLRTIPTVMLTSSDTREERSLALSLKADAFLVKPLGYAGYADIVVFLDKLLSSHKHI